MKIYNKINPIAKTLRDKKYSKQVIPSKKKVNLDKLSEKEARDAKTKQDTWTHKDLQLVNEGRTVW